MDQNCALSAFAKCNLSKNVLPISGNQPQVPFCVSLKTYDFRSISKSAKLHKMHAIYERMENYLLYEKSAFPQSFWLIKYSVFDFNQHQR